MTSMFGDLVPLRHVGFIAWIFLERRLHDFHALRTSSMRACCISHVDFP